MISEMDVMLLNGTLKIVCHVCDDFLRMPLPVEKTLQTLQGVHNFALGFLGNVSVAERTPSKLPKTIGANKKKQLKAFECILQDKLTTARLNFFPSDFKGSWAIVKDIPN